MLDLTGFKDLIVFEDEVETDKLPALQPYRTIALPPSEKLLKPTPRMVTAFLPISVLLLFSGVLASATVIPLDFIYRLALIGISIIGILVTGTICWNSVRQLKNSQPR